MTEPGYVAPPTPGWWVRRGRVGTIASGHEWDVSAVGTIERQGSASGAYTWAGSAAGITPAWIVGTPTTATTATFALPTHAVGDLIIIFAFTSSALAVTQPAAGGTVPTWTSIDSATGLRVSQTVATATNHTSGAWTNANRMIAVVIRDQHSTPIGGHAIDNATSTTPTAPAATLTNTDGTSILLHFYGSSSVSGGAWAAAPAGYTRLADVFSASNGACLNRKDVTTTDGAIVQGTTINVAWRTATVEIRSH